MPDIKRPRLASPRSAVSPSTQPRLHHHYDPRHNHSPPTPHQQHAAMQMDDRHHAYPDRHAHYHPVVSQSSGPGAIPAPGGPGGPPPGPPGGASAPPHHHPQHHRQYSAEPLSARSHHYAEYPGEYHEYRPQEYQHDPQAYDPQGYYAYGSQAMQQNGNPRKKAVRASQACESCRQKKCKCDEIKPVCGTCQASNTECHYRDVPPPKQERTMLEVIEKIDILGQSMRENERASQSAWRELRDSLKEDIHGLNARIDRLASTRPPGPHPPLLASPAYHGSEQRRDIASPGSQHSPYRHSMTKEDPGKATPTQSFNNQLDPDIMRKDMLEGTLSIPQSHDTAAHKLLQYWKSIEKFYQDVTTNDYVMRGEMERGPLKIYSRGEAHGQTTRFSALPAAPSPDQTSSDGASVSSGSNGAENSWWGVGFDAERTRTSNRRPDEIVGGLNVDEDTLNLEADVVRRLTQSYLDTHYTMHPFLGKRELWASVERFIAQYSPTTRGHKRKRSGTLPDSSARPDYGGAIERSPHNAVILLVLALGKVCEWKDNLPSSDPDVPEHTAAAYSSHPPSTYGTPQPQGSPMAPPSGGPAGSPLATAPTNRERMPGMAYYAYAVETLGATYGAADLKHVQAYLLAGLYMGQFVRVIESWRWIHAAGTTCQLLFSGRDDLSHYPQQQAELVRVAFWSCHQLESDILAELDQLPQSGVSRYEDLIDHPKPEQCPSTGSARADKEDELIYMYYSAQIEIRKLLNRAHTALYTSGRERMKNVGWAQANAELLAESLTHWRDMLPQALKWEDTAPKAETINDARLRGKYYGALYVIHRPFLHHLLQKEEGVESSGPRPGAPDSWTIKTSKDQVSMAHKCVEAAKKSTVAFDGVLGGRLIITSIFGTAHAQFGNCLVLAAVHLTPKFRWMVPEHEVFYYLRRTIDFIRRLAPLSPTMRTNIQILENTIRWIHNSGGGDGGRSHSTSGPSTATATAQDDATAATTPPVVNGNGNGNPPRKILEHSPTPDLAEARHHVLSALSDHLATSAPASAPPYPATTSSASTSFSHHSA